MWPEELRLHDKGGLLSVTFDSGERYDLIVDIPGGRSWADLKRALAPDGRYVIIGHDGYGRASRWIGSMGSISKLMLPAGSNVTGTPGDRTAVALLMRSSVQAPCKPRQRK